MRMKNHQKLISRTVRLQPSVAKMLRLVAWSLDMSENCYLNSRLPSILRADVDAVIGGDGVNEVDETDKLILKKLAEGLKLE